MTIVTFTVDKTISIQCDNTRPYVGRFRFRDIDKLYFSLLTQWIFNFVSKENE